MSHGMSVREVFHMYRVGAVDVCESVGVECCAYGSVIGQQEPAVLDMEHVYQVEVIAQGQVDDRGLMGWVAREMGGLE